MNALTIATSAAALPLALVGPVVSSTVPVDMHVSYRDERPALLSMHDIYRETVIKLTVESYGTIDRPQQSLEDAYAEWADESYELAEQSMSFSDADYGDR